MRNFHHFVNCYYSISLFLFICFKMTAGNYRNSSAPTLFSVIYYLTGINVKITVGGGGGGGGIRCWGGGGFIPPSLSV
jgi:hypothetical protein